MSSCPLGFGTSNSKALSKYHCVLCRSLLYDAVSLVPCSHIFCRSCCSKTSSCPVCGRDIEGRSVERNVQDEADTLLAVHATPAALLQLDRPDDQSMDDHMRHPAGVLLHVALQSLRGGNIEAAIKRLQMCILIVNAGLNPGQYASPISRPTTHALVSEETPVKEGPRCPFGFGRQASKKASTTVKAESGESAAGNTGSPDAEKDIVSPEKLRYLKACALGILGDICARSHDHEEALKHYTEATQSFSTETSLPPDSSSAKAVSHSKGGDMCIWLQDLDLAASHYRQCVELRRAALVVQTTESPNGGREFASSKELDVDVDGHIVLVRSLAKLLDCLSRIKMRVRYKMTVSEPWFSKIQRGEKAVEGRVAQNDFNKVRAGDWITWTVTGDTDSSASCQVTVVSVARYETFHGMLTAEGLDACVPGAECSCVEDGVSIYRGFYDEATEQKNGVVAIRMRVISNGPISGRSGESASDGAVQSSGSDTTKAGVLEEARDLIEKVKGFVLTALQERQLQMIEGALTPSA